MNAIERNPIERILAARLVGIVRLDDLELAVGAAAAAIAAGLDVVEITFTLEGAARAIERLRRDHPDSLVGAGTVRTRPELEAAVAAGAQFLVAPGLNLELLEMAAGHGVPMLPGVFTASEIDLALRHGAGLLKLFPAEPLGPAYVASLLQPFPQARLLPTGGVTAANAADYLQAGAVGVAMGSSLFPAGRIASEGPQLVEALARAALEAVR